MSAPVFPRALVDSQQASSTSRRSIITALAALPIGAVLPLGTVEAAPPLRREREAWDLAVTSFDAAKAAWRRHWEGLLKPALDAYDAIPGPPPRSFACHGVQLGFDPGRCDKWANEPDQEVREGGLRLKTEWAAYRKAQQGMRSSLDLDALSFDDECLCSEECDAEIELFQTPSPDLKALLFKMELMWSDDRDAPESYRNWVLADVQRLSGRSA
jgi:hypothetical protein